MRIPPFLIYVKKSIFLLFFYIALSVVLMSFNDSESLYGIRWFLLTVIEEVDYYKMKFTFQRNLEAQNELLKKENFHLHMTNQRLREVLVENARLRRLLHWKKSGEYDLVAARVVGKSPEKNINTLLLNIGRQDSVYKNLAVVNADGLVGKVIATTGHQAIVQILKDHNSRVGVVLQNSREQGMIGWSGNSWLDLLNIPKNIAVEEGEMVITSGFSRIYPAGLKVGVVTSVEENNYDLFKTIKVKSAVNFNAVEEVFVIRKERPGITSSE